MVSTKFDIIYFYLPHEDPSLANRNYSFMDLMIHSAKSVGFDGDFIFYTHENARLPDDLPVDRIVRIAPEGVAETDVMLLKAYSHHHFAYSELFVRPAISAESDQLFQSSPLEAFSLPFDIGLTYAHWDKEIDGDFGKINGGVTYFNNQDIPAVRSYLSAYIAMYLMIRDEVDYRFEARPRLAKWGGDELSHIRLLPPDAFDDHRQERRCFKVADARVMLLEAVKFNCPQGERDGDNIDIRNYPSAVIRHFVGWRKGAMPDYANQFLGLKLEPSTVNSWGTKVTKVAPR